MSIRWHAVVALLLVACVCGVIGTQWDPRDDGDDSFSEAHLARLMPQWEEWGAGNICPDGGVCVGPAELAHFRRERWIEAIAVTPSIDPETHAATALDVAGVRLRAPRVGTDRFRLDGSAPFALEGER